MFENKNQEKKIISSLLSMVVSSKLPVVVSNISKTVSVYIAYQFYLFSRKSVIIIVPDEQTVGKYIDELFFFSGDKSSDFLLYFPTYNISPFNFEKLVYYTYIASKRIVCLYRLLRNNCSYIIIIVNTKDFYQKFIPRNALDEYAELIFVGSKISIKGLINKLICGGYRHNFVVKEYGDFFIRGSMVEIFSPLYYAPIRIEFFGEFIESIRIFSVVSKRSIKKLEEFLILPVCEMVFIKNNIGLTVGKFRYLSIKHGLLKMKINSILGTLENRMVFSGIENLAFLVYDYAEMLFDYISSSYIFKLQIFNYNGFFGIKNRGIFFDASNGVVGKGKLFLFKNKFLVNYFLSIGLITSSRNCFIKKKFPKIKCERIGIDLLYNTNFIVYNKEIQDKKKSMLVASIVKITLKNLSMMYSTVIICNSKNQLKHIDFFLFSNGIKTTIIEGVSGKFSKNSVYLCFGRINDGFVLPIKFLSIVKYEEFITSNLERRKFFRIIKNSKNEDSRLVKNGEFVVHADHGIGKYSGLFKLDVNGVMSDFLLILYRNNDRLYLPIDRMFLIQKYMDMGNNYFPYVNKIGGRVWTRLKGKARDSVNKVASILLEIYAKRKIQIGYSFFCNKKRLNEFESGFVHEETTDQLKSIEDVLSDMKKNIPMDRLVCGDVGCGKTEVALRASFVAVNEAKQVAVLVPTTVLAEQHYETFSRRFKQSSIEIACLSRFKSKIQQVELIKRVKNGIVDIVIGTHRLLQKDVFFMDLGLIILDEEQRFGVKYKEKLRKIRISVDVLTLTATPIPRTLHLSLMNLRDTSIISTPPDRRRPIITYISELDYRVVVEAIRYELMRDGQIFFVHNDIRTIQIVARRLKSWIPEVKLGIAHGQMNEKKLEKVMINFVDGKIDMLICTTIIESGIDIGRANTIMVNRADRFGLSQIYQIRGRVGRSDLQAYAYLFIPNKGIIGEKANRRLRVLMQHTDLGSGFQIAASDMRIRGCGTILGSFQSGHISAVGYYMFLKLMEESIANLKGGGRQVFIRTEINFFVSAYISREYIFDIDQRLLVYRKLAKVRCLKDVSMIKNELVDRFGIIPEETSSLLLKSMLKILANRAGVRQIDIFNRKLTLYFIKINKYSVLKVYSLILNCSSRYEIFFEDTLIVNFFFDTLKVCLSKVRKILVEIIRKVEIKNF